MSETDLTQSDLGRSRRVTRKGSLWSQGSCLSLCLTEDVEVSDADRDPLGSLASPQYGRVKKGTEFFLHQLCLSLLLSLCFLFFWSSCNSLSYQAACEVATQGHLTILSVIEANKANLSLSPISNSVSRECLPLHRILRGFHHRNSLKMLHY